VSTKREVLVQDAVKTMLARYNCRSTAEYTNALQEILQEIALLGLWRGKFFEHGAFYGGTALRILYGLDRFSEDLDFSLLRLDKKFQLSKYLEPLEKELSAFGFRVTVEEKNKSWPSAVQSAFLKTETAGALLVITSDEAISHGIPAGKLLKIKLEIDTEPPPGFNTETKYILRPISFGVRTYALPDLFAGKLHAILCRQWKNRVKGRDWYDLVWYVANYPQVHLVHLEERMRQSGHWLQEGNLGKDELAVLLSDAIETLDVEQAKKDVIPFIKDTDTLDVWSRGFFQVVCSRIEGV
jgi:predicted nucleotidyltransferase component of viral defense system